MKAPRKTVWVATGWDAGGSVRSGATFEGLYCERLAVRSGEPNEPLAAMTPRLLEQVDIDGCLNERLPFGLLKYLDRPVFTFAWPGVPHAPFVLASATAPRQRYA